MDPAGTCLSIVALILLVYGLTTGNVHGWGEADVVATLVVSVVLLAVFALVQLKFSSDPILPRYLWSDRIKMLGCLMAALTYAIWQGSNYLLTLELQSQYQRESRACNPYLTCLKQALASLLYLQRFAFFLLESRPCVSILSFRSSFSASKPALYF